MISNLAESPVARPHLPRVPDVIVKDLVKVFKLLSDETRLRVLLYLTQQQELHVRALCDLLAQSQPAVSHHLALLRVAGLIESRAAKGSTTSITFCPTASRRCSIRSLRTSPRPSARIRFEDYVLSYAPSGSMA